MDNILEIKNLFVKYPNSKRYAVENVSLSVRRGKTLALVGESGCGKTTLARAAMRLIKAESGSVLFDGLDILKLNKSELRRIRPKMQTVFQNPYDSLSPRMRIEEFITEAPLEHGIITRRERRVYAERLLVSCGLSSHDCDKLPSELSGGQRQRVCIARALSLKPSFLICDEPTSALDASVRAQIINLLLDKRESENLSCLFITHDLPLAIYFSDDVAVMRDGKIVESGAADELFGVTENEYVKMLLEKSRLMVDT